MTHEQDGARRLSPPAPMQAAVQTPIQGILEDHKTIHLCGPRTKVYLDQGVITSCDKNIGAVFSVANSIHIICMRSDPHSSLQLTHSLTLDLFFFFFVLVLVFCSCSSAFLGRARKRTHRSVRQGLLRSSRRNGFFRLGEWAQGRSLIIELNQIFLDLSSWVLDVTEMVPDERKDLQLSHCQTP